MGDMHGIQQGLEKEYFEQFKTVMKSGPFVEFLIEDKRHGFAEDG